jgi:hypothetical protein
MTEDERSQEEREAEAEKGFKVEDRRRFSQSGDERSESAASEEPADVEPEPPEQPAQQEEASHPQAAEMNFSSFAFGLASQALMSLGLAPDPASGVVHKDLAQAHGLIDILAMLEEKTRGNLDEDEARMMEEMLYELRMQFVRVSRGDSDPQETT